MLQELVEVAGQQMFRLYLFSIVAFMSGLAGGKGGDSLCGSCFMDETNARTVLLCTRSLEYLDQASPQAIYWSYMTERSKHFSLSHDSPEDLALLRLACLARVQDQRGYQRMCSAWELLDVSSRRVLVDSLLADGIETEALVFEFLPLCIEKAQANVNVGLHILLDVMVDLVGQMQVMSFITEAFLNQS